MPTFNVSHKTSYTYAESVLVCHNEVRLTPRATPRQGYRDFWLFIEPEPTQLGSRQDYFGNFVNFFALVEPHRSLSITASSKVNVEPAAIYTPGQSPKWNLVHDQVPADFSKAGLDAMQYIYHSARITPNTNLAEYAMPSFGPDRPIIDGAMELMTRIYTDFKYDPTATHVNTPLHEVMEKRAGVCQDLAHVGVGCLRSIGLPARYVSGYLRTLPPAGQERLVGADESHAWFSLYCGELGWVDFDPTNNVIPSGDHITLAWGRDYNDICPSRGVYVGGGEHTMKVEVDVEEIKPAQTQTQTQSQA